MTELLVSQLIDHNSQRRKVRAGRGTVIPHLRFPPSGAQTSCYMLGRHPAAFVSRHQLSEKFSLLQCKGVGF